MLPQPLPSPVGVPEVKEPKSCWLIRWSSEFFQSLSLSAGDRCVVGSLSGKEKIQTDYCRINNDGRRRSPCAVAGWLERGAPQAPPSQEDAVKNQTEKMLYFGGGRRCSFPKGKLLLWEIVGASNANATGVVFRLKQWRLRIAG